MIRSSYLEGVWAEPELVPFLIIVISLIVCGLVAALLLLRILRNRSFCPKCRRKFLPGQVECPLCGGDMIGSTIEAVHNEPDSMGWLVAEQGPEIGRTYGLRKDEVLVGRDTSSEIVIDDEAVSRRHAKIKSLNGYYILHDLASTNRTFVNDEPITSRRMDDGDRIRVGNVVFVFRCMTK